MFVSVHCAYKYLFATDLDILSPWNWCLKVLGPKQTWIQDPFIQDRDLLIRGQETTKDAVVKRNNS